MSSHGNIQRLRDKRKSLEEAYSHSPKRKSGEPSDVSKAVSRAVSMVGAVEPTSNGTDSLSMPTMPRASTSSAGSSKASNAFSTTVLEHIQFLEMKLKALEGLEDRLKVVEKTTQEVEKDKSPKYPTDSYSLIAMNGPKPSFLWYELWSEQKCFYFWLFGMMVFLFQTSLYALVLFGQTDMRWGTVPSSGNPASGFFADLIPPNTSGFVRVAQVVSLLVYVIFPDSTVNDLLNAYKYFPRCLCSNTNEDPVWAMRFACFLKGSQALFGIVTTWLLVMTSDSVLAIILNFTAINFISDIDDRAYSLAKDGVFGQFLKTETSERIGDTKLPGFMHKTGTGYYAMILTSLGLVLIGFLISVVTTQDSPNIWVTTAFSLELTDGRRVFELDKNSTHFNRYTYNNRDAKTSISYCADDRKWYLLNVLDDTKSIDPCSAYVNGIDIASSSETGSFDISAAFTDTWTSRGGTPLGVQFSEATTENSYCALTATDGNSMDEANVGVRRLGDGICDEDLNTANFEYDGGDCCAATCEGPRCGKKVLESAFGKTNPSVAGFPNCKDPEKTVRITMHLNGVKSGRRVLDTSDLDDIPPATYFALRCDEKDVLSGYVEEVMVNNSETVMVEDGAGCSLVVSGAKDLVSPDPTWYIDYTLYHGDTDNEDVMILNQHSNQEESVSFQLIPNCYFEELGSHIEAGTIYNTASGSSSKAIGWLVEDDTDVVQCGEEDFIERFALAKMNFAMSESVDSITRDHHCEWPSISCTEGRVDTISFGYEELAGDIPSDIGTLTSVTRLDLRFNDIVSLPNEIGSMSRLEVIDLDGNKLSSIPTGIGLLTGLEELLLSYNEISSLPSEIGLVSNLRLLTMAGNKLSSLPSEIGLLGSVETLHLHGNKLTSIPTEIGLMSGLRTLSLNGNQLASVPSEIGLLTGLQELLLFDNAPLLSIPEEIRALSSSHNLTLYGTDVTCKNENLPGELAA
eukprot:CAMPEP_0116123948 /NCGR_PEP_ID=MMETSP0329-20121206/5021_1 /TAXON_ID=697910 /ORGANISM="Pseudo-nitzschia arenysensis, Strain B593" /LENGTH=968 /DNA_ID=CAMNT_0003617899 /DNA_START=197 /DNA_END=3101 /DNA_ORIENTATION=+